MLDKRLKVLNGLVPSASDLSQSAEEIRNWVLEMVALSVEDCKSGYAIGPEGEALVNMVMAYHGFEDLYTKLVAFPIDAPRLHHGSAEVPLAVYALPTWTKLTANK